MAVVGKTCWVEPHAEDVEQWWRDGWLMREIAERLGRTTGTIGTAMAWMRVNGYDLPERPGYRSRGGVEVRFEAKVKRGETCWEWVGVKNDAGYGQMVINGQMEYAHRISLRLLGRTVPNEMEVHHACRNPGCVNPDHLVLLTPADHKRVEKYARPHCRQGHRWTPENTYIRPDTGTRSCRECRRLAKARWAAR